MAEPTESPTAPVTAPLPEADLSAFPPCPQPPNWEVQYELLNSRFPWLRELRGCPQDPIRHAEGDVWTHVGMVLERMATLPAWRELPPLTRHILFTAAMLHDVAKPHCTRRDADGRLTSRGHSWRGAIMARRILWRLGVPFAWREQVAALVRHHLVPLYLHDREEPDRLITEVSQTARCDYLTILAECDARGRTCPDPQKLLDNIAFFRDRCEARGCLTEPYRFPSERTHFAYFHNKPEEAGPFPCEVVLMSGLPGSGKDYWLRYQSGLNWPVISIDELRVKLGVAPNEPQGPVLQEARERARGFLRQRQSFVWNAPNLSRQIRSECVKLYASHDARVRIVYVEVPPDRLFYQNRQRRNRVPQAVIERMLDRWEVPDLTECHAVEYVIGS